MPVKIFEIVQSLISSETTSHTKGLGLERTALDTMMDWR